MLGLLAGCDTAADTNADTDDGMVNSNNATDPSPDRDPDLENTGINERDADGDTATPFDQSNDQDDIDLVAEIRAAVLEIDDLTINAQNIKIITNDGKVLLRGPVHSADEREAIEAVANEIAGAGNVTSQLEVDAEDEGEL
jgi:hypothetical protein